MKNFFSFICMSSFITTVCVLGNAYAQDQTHPKYSGSLESLTCSTRSEANADGKIFLSIFLDKPYQIDWRIKKGLKLIWRKEAIETCSTGPVGSKTRYEFPVMSCDVPRSVPASMHHCGLIAGMSGTFTCSPGSAQRLI